MVCALYITLPIDGNQKTFYGPDVVACTTEELFARLCTFSRSPK
jgi:hypothetical protein